MTTRPDHTEAAEYYFTYIDQVPEGDILATLRAQAGQAAAFLRGISEDQSLRRYAPDKWSIRQVVGHVNDTERVFGFRALWFARGFDTPLPSFDQNVAVPESRSDDRSWQSHIDEFEAVRAATLGLYGNLPDAAWTRRGIASGKPVSVRALAYIIAGHLAHHVKIVGEKYLGK
jgi:DinB superfamily